MSSRHRSSLASAAPARGCAKVIGSGSDLAKAKLDLIAACPDILTVDPGEIAASYRFDQSVAACKRAAQPNSPGVKIQMTF